MSNTHNYLEKYCWGIPSETAERLAGDEAAGRFFAVSAYSIINQYEHYFQPTIDEVLFDLQCGFVGDIVAANELEILLSDFVSDCGDQIAGNEPQIELIDYFHLLRLLQGAE